MSPKKTLILHDTFLYRGGGERLVLLMANCLEADIASGFFSPGSYDLREQGFQGKAIPLMPAFFLHDFEWLPKKIAFVLKNGLRHFGLKWAFARGAKKLAEEYDTIIFSGDCLSAVDHFRGKNILYYCHTIPRYLFDQQKEYERKVPKIMLHIYQVMTARFKKLYLQDLGKVEKILTNSRNTQKRIKHYTGRNADILYPPVDTDFFRPGNGEKKGYFLSFARLSSIKRVDRIVEAFFGTKENLIITYGKNDPEKNTITKMIEGQDNIEMKLSPSDNELRKLIQEATATIYVPVDEDFGMSPVESMACGTPVIGVDDGGLKESIIQNKTGILIHPRCLPEDIKKAVENISEVNIQSQDCIDRARDFSLHSFKRELEKILKI